MASPTEFPVRPAIPFNHENITGPLFDPPEPLIERLAEAARPKKEQPTAGWYGISKAPEPTVEVPPECLLYEDDYFKFSLGKVPKYRDYPQQMPKELAWVAPDDEMYVFTPLHKVQKKEGSKSKLAAKLEDLKIKEDPNVNTVKKMQEEQKKVKASEVKKDKSVTGKIGSSAAPAPNPKPVKAAPKK